MLKRNLRKWADDTGVVGGEFLVLTALVDRAKTWFLSRSDPVAQASLPDLASDTLLSRSWVIEVVKRLSERGLIQVRKCPGSSNTYRLLVSGR